MIVEGQKKGHRVNVFIAQQYLLARGVLATSSITEYG